jgi:hypothetical protein
VAAKLHHVGDVETLDLPRIAKVEPEVGLLDLRAVANALKEHAVLIAQTVAPRRVVLRRQRVDEARGEAAETAVAEAGVLLLGHAELESDAELAHRLADALLEAEVDDGVLQRAAHEVLHREVVDALRVFGVKVHLRVFPALDQVVAHSVRQRQIVGLILRTLADTERVLEMANKVLLQRQHVGRQSTPPTAPTALATRHAHDAVERNRLTRQRQLVLRLTVVFVRRRPRRRRAIPNRLRSPS